MTFGIEKELLLFDKNFEPVNFMQDELPKNVVLDFADNQLEIVTEVHNDIENAYSQIASVMQDKIFTSNTTWPLSMPPKRDFEVRHIGTQQKDKIEYRQHLENAYGLDKMLISGIHLNIGFDNSVFKTNDEQNDFYFEIFKKIYTFAPLLLQFTAFSPACDNEGFKDIGKIAKNYSFDNSISIRNSCKFGYSNEHLLSYDFSSYKNYKLSIENAIKNDLITSQAELYSKARLKGSEELIDYIELRFIDINPYELVGIRKEELHLFSAFMKYCKDMTLKEFDIDTSLCNFNAIATKGQDKNKSYVIDGVSDTLENQSKKLLEAILQTKDLSLEEISSIQNILKEYISKTTPLDMFLNKLSGNEYTKIAKELAHNKNEFIYKEEYSSLELSSSILIQEAKKRNYKVEVLDEYNNVLRISTNGKEEIVFKATKTSKDGYVNVLIMENKYITKLLLDEQGITTPQGYKLTKDSTIDYEFFKQKKAVIKPLDTNFGIGITMLDINPSKNVLDKAFSLAFSLSNEVIVEEFCEGDEYRFLVMNGKVTAITKRVPANVIGDGSSTIQSLINIKNKDPLRGSDHQKPLEKIIVDEQILEYLNKQNKNINYIAKIDEVVYLRENSNISTGGDSIEYNQLIPQYYIDIAVKAVEIMDVKMCGLDMLIPDLYDIRNPKYSIIETNFNPAMYMHVYPYRGYGVNVGEQILDILFEE